jgi:hypothetical protein
MPGYFQTRLAALHIKRKEACFDPANNGQRASSRIYAAGNTMNTMKAYFGTTAKAGRLQVFVYGFLLVLPGFGRSRIELGASKLRLVAAFHADGNTKNTMAAYF